MHYVTMRTHGEGFFFLLSVIAQGGMQENFKMSSLEASKKWFLFCQVPPLKWSKGKSKPVVWPAKRVAAPLWGVMFS